jgi:L-gulonate 3-dehydrogenase
MNVDLPVACIGAGTVGRSWAALFARAGYRVALYDSEARRAEEALSWISQIADPGRVWIAGSLDQAVLSATYVQESVIEDASIKREVFTSLDRFAPADAILASSTSQIVGSRFIEGLPGASRCLISHPLNPPHLVRLVELCGTPWTSEAAIARASEILERAGQRPIRVRKEVDGFVANRLQVAVLVEALHLVSEGYCSVKDVERALTDGLAPRWTVVGPFETGHLNAPGGYRDYLHKYGPALRAIAGTLAGASASIPDWTPELIERIDQACREMMPGIDIEMRQALRDRKLAALREWQDT